MNAENQLTEREQRFIERMAREEDEREERIREADERAAAAASARRSYLEKLLGSKDRYDWNAPRPVEDFDTILAEHAAQLRNAVRFTLDGLLTDNVSTENQAKYASAVDRLIRTNLAIAKVLGPAKHAKSKTVHGGSATGEPQD
jgi:hypothetical protein